MLVCLKQNCICCCPNQNPVLPPPPPSPPKKKKKNTKKMNTKVNIKNKQVQLGPPGQSVPLVHWAHRTPKKQTKETVRHRPRQSWNIGTRCGFMWKGTNCPRHQLWWETWKRMEHCRFSLGNCIAMDEFECGCQSPSPILLPRLHLRLSP